MIDCVAAKLFKECPRATICYMLLSTEISGGYLFGIIFTAICFWVCDAILAAYSKSCHLVADRSV